MVMKPCLPQKDLNKEQRLAELLNQRKNYEYDYTYLSPLVLIKEVPKEDHFSSQYISERLRDSAKLIPNILAVTARELFDPLDKLQDYEDFFNVLPLPKVAKVYQTDQSFAEQRLSGPNPLVLCLLKSDDKRVQVLKQISDLQLGNGSALDLDQELRAGNVYVADYTGTDSKYRGPSLVKGGTHEKGHKYLPKPLVFFWWENGAGNDRGKLLPIAIQLVYDPENSTNSVVHTPSDSNPDWSFAKICVQVADANHHEMNSHLCRTHFVMEPIAGGVARQLAENHPLSILLKPHFRFMLANNHLGRERLVNPDGPVDKLLAGTRDESLALVKDA